MKHLMMVLLAVGCAAKPVEDTTPARGHMGDGSDPVAPRVTHPEAGLTCRDESPTGTGLDRRKCRSDAEKAQDRKVVEDLYNDPSSRVGCPDGGCTPGPKPNGFGGRPGQR